VIAFLGNRPVIQVGRHQVTDYDTRWLGRALRRAAEAADHPDFPFLDEIRQGIEEYLDSRCPLELLPLPTLYSRMRRMLRVIGCPSIADKLEQLAPPVTLCLEHAARRAGNGFELAFFQELQAELEELREAGVEEVHFTGLHESIRIIRGHEAWDADCERLLDEIHGFLRAHDRDARRPRPALEPERRD